MSKVKKAAQKIFPDLTPFTHKQKDLSKFTMRQTLVQRHGVGHPMAKIIMEHSGYSFDYSKRFDDLRVTFLTRRMNQFFEQYDQFFDDKLRNKVKEDVRRYIRIGARRGYQHRDKLPVNGQGTKKTNLRRRVRHY